MDIRLLAALLLLAAPLTSSASRESFDIAVPVAPSPVTIDGESWLIYELHLTNFSREPLRLLQVEVLAADRTLQSFEGENLTRRLALAGVPREDVQPVKPGERAIVYVEAPATARPLRHRVRYDTAAGERGEVLSGAVAVTDNTGDALGAPLRGGTWAAVYAWEWPRGHRRVFYTLDGRARLPGRFAIDWVRKDAQGLAARGDADVVKNSLGYGAEVLAVADARVAAVRDGMAESDKVSANPKPTLDDAAGNYIALDLGRGRYALYEHLVPGSIRVAVGDRVRRGQAIAALGFTGSSTEPHLHFHVADSPAPLLGEGLPFVFEQFQVQGSPSPIRRRERPAPNALVTF
jgi:murein DD-endopeptidase MepM/ murein hydrolase activator NlpD